MQKRILYSLMIIGVVGAVVFGATQAFFSDTEESTDNVLAAGSLDLKIDNTCYYNGRACIQADGTDGRYYWDGEVAEGNECSCTWQEKDLGEGDTFFDLRDLKPGDWEEDTISLHVVDNDAWACAEITPTTNDDVSCTDPELVDDPSCSEPNEDPNDGELAQALNWVFWWDDGDNVLETDERARIFHEGPLTDRKIVLADAETNNVGGEDGDPLIGSHTYYIGKAFCYGDITLAPVEQGDNNNPTLDPGIECDGEPVNNASQTDEVTADVKFYAEQWRNNPKFLCNPETD